MKIDADMRVFAIGEVNFQLPESLDALKPVDFSKPSDQMLTVELFAGTATLSAELRQAGFPNLVVDKSSVRQPKVNLIELDITTPNGPAVLLQTLFSANICYFRRAPPCGTASSARDKPLPFNMQHI